MAAFFIDELNLLEENITARGPKVTKAPAGIVVLDDLLNEFEQVPFLLRADMLKSDEAIVVLNLKERIMIEFCFE